MTNSTEPAQSEATTSAGQHTRSEATSAGQPAQSEATRAAGRRVHAFTDDALGDLDATGVAAAIRDGSISAAEAVGAAIARSAAVEGELHGLVRDDFDRARRRASEPRPGAFSGVPSALKDNVHVAGLAMTEGSAAFPTTPVAKDDALVQQFLGTGLIPIGTTTMPEFGWTASTETLRGDTHNPWHTGYSSGGSSGGSAAYVAAGVVPIAHGNDGGGSIRIPASACGLVGLKPTRGRLRTPEADRTMPVRIVSNSVLARSVRDVAGFFADAERSYRNRTLPPIGLVDRPTQRRLRVGLMLDSPAAPPTDPVVRAGVEDFGRLLESLGHTVEPYAAPVPEFFADDFASYWRLLALLGSRMGRQMFGEGFDRSKLEPLTDYLASDGLRTLAKAPVFLPRLLASSAASRLAFRRGPDLVLTPVLTQATPQLGFLGADVDPAVHFQRLLDLCGFTPLANASGGPAISLPAGQNADGVPFGAMLSATHGAERLLLEVALQVEAARPFPRIQD
ncbi:amidase [Calidifontibacter sp. DB0510]|uniref:Amidase n=1 Tax=Metallococcus carri TaxID=1656884 RepID=A0A967EHE9_9MICO|nr:amidase [Metallococcus carri]NHN56253.1 amidase [Metallococcus carri]NOP38695.1 amidase [Calidifontibacter sp. DB2511S]